MRRSTGLTLLLSISLLPSVAYGEMPPPPVPKDGSSSEGASPPDVPSTPETETTPAPAPTTSAIPAKAPPGVTPTPPKPVILPSDSDDSVRPARDTIGGHLVLGANVGLIVPFGLVSGGNAQSDLIGPGLWLAGDALYGVSRAVGIGAYAEVAMPAGKNDARGKDFTSIAAGAMVRYHLVQGVRFDPWLAAGVGFRRTGDGEASLTGIDWARFQIGGDWYAASQLGFGPIVELALGTFTGSSRIPLETKAVNAHFVIGGRIVFDSPGK